MADSVGQIGLDLVVNQNGFDKQMRGITGLAKKAGAALAAAFAVKKIFDFGKSAVRLGSQLAEVDNVIQQAVPSMEKQIDSFAKNAIQQFGMSEIAAKQYTGVFASMSRGFGFTEKSAASMGVTLTSLAADVASFYDTSQDEAFTKLKSIFTGETESLKSLGVVMTQNALDAYALANGYGKTTKAMSEAEKVALRYAFVQEKLKFAQGDFARNSDTWANQVRILSEQFNALKATIGQGLINVLTPVIKLMNALLAKIQTVANAFKSFTEMLTGKKSQEASSGVGNIASNAETATKGLDGITEAAKKATKATNALSIDELNIATPDNGKGGSSSGADLADMGLAGDMAAAMEDAANRSTTALEKIKDRLKEISDIFMTGFKTGLGDVDFSKITSSLGSIKDSLKGIFTAPEVAAAASKWVDSIALSLGKVTGSAASIGTTTATLLTGSIAGYLEQNSEFIKGKIVSILDASSRAQEIGGNLAVALADIFTIFQSPAALKIGSDLIAIFANSFLSLVDLGVTFGADVIEAIARPIINNKDKIKKALENTLKPIETVVGGVKVFVENAFSSMKRSYDTYIAPALEKFSTGFNTVFSALLDAYNTYVAPVLQNIADKFSLLLTNHINPMIEAFQNLAGGIVLAVAKIWDETLAPFIAWVIENLAPPFSEALETITNLFMDIAGAIADVIAGALEKLGEFVNWIGDNQETIITITGVIAGFFAAWQVVKLASFIQQSGGVVSALGSLLTPLSSATTAILANAGAFIKNTAAKIADKAETIILTAMYAKDFVVSLASGTAALVKQAAQWVITTGMKAADTVATIASTAATTAATAATWLFNAALTILTSPITLVVVAIAGLIAIGVLLYKNWEEIKEKALEIFEAIKTFIVKTFETIKTNILKVWDAIKGFITKTITNIKEKFEEIFGAIKTFVVTIFTNIKEGIHEKITAIKDGLAGALNAIKEKWDTIWNNLKTTVTDIFNSIWTNIKGVINSILGGIEGMANGVVRGVNKVIGALNNLSFEIPDWIPGLGGKTFGFNIPSLSEINIPKLAQGGYVKANTPQLAMIGDNRHQGEVVAPEDKMLEMAVKAAELVNGKNQDSTYLPIVIELLNRIIDILEALDLNLELDGKSILKGLKETKKRMGFQF